VTPGTRLGLRDDAEDDRHTLSLLGELDAATAPELQAAIERLCEEGAREIVLDLHELSFIDSTGLRAILMSERLCERLGSDFSLTRAQPQAQRLFELADLVGRLSFRGRAFAKRITRRPAYAAKTPLAHSRPDFEVFLDLNLSAPRSARNYVRDLLRADVSPRLRDTAMLLTSELVTPIVRQVIPAFLETGELRVWLRGDVVRVELAVPSELLSPPSGRSGPPYDQTVLDQLADRWSIDIGGPSSRVWFELVRQHFLEDGLLDTARR